MLSDKQGTGQTDFDAIDAFAGQVADLVAASPAGSCWSPAAARSATRSDCGSRPTARTRTPRSR
ncbi:hypothetical protein ACFQ1I_33215 [Kitasatospora arboriphila]